jgi:outer membrane receptor protein involved in Fe transport
VQFINERIGNGQCQSVRRCRAPGFSSTSRRRRSASGVGCEYSIYGLLRDRHTFDHASRFSVTAGGRQLRPNQFDRRTRQRRRAQRHHAYTHFNPMVGATYKLTPNLTFYGDFAEANPRRPS